MVVAKEDGGHMFCVGFRRLNAITKPLAVSLPLTDDILTLLGKAQYFSTIDLRSGYWQVGLACHLVLFQFRVMSFGFAPGIFQQLMTSLSDDEDFAVAYLDDILVFPETPGQHFDHLR